MFQNKIANRRSFLRCAGIAGAAAAGTGIATVTPLRAQAPIGQFKFDTPTQIFTAALIAEDLATTFYYNGLIGACIQDPSLAGPGGSATNVTAAGNAGNVNYLQAALSEEIAHANLLRSLLGISAPANDPVQTFYLPKAAFATAPAFLSLLDTLESAFIGAYLLAVRSFAYMSALLKGGGVAGYTNFQDFAYTTDQMQYYGEVAASILGVEAEHRVLGRVISNTNPANNFCYEQNDGLGAVYTGPASAVAALTPFLAPGSGLVAYSFATALANQASVSLACSGGLPPQ
ncbi:MAG TPA: ferritin-like domain-containing protein [Bryobacteraceae bacterium]|jgi:hypothetical protein|nr:ferritin-like domain-containing protein [Bryobacteraceae bacterium]